MLTGSGEAGRCRRNSASTLSGPNGLSPTIAKLLVDDPPVEVVEADAHEVGLGGRPSAIAISRARPAGFRRRGLRYGGPPLRGSCFQSGGRSPGIRPGNMQHLGSTGSAPVDADQQLLDEDPRGTRPNTHVRFGPCR
ncbi:hypothetical protein PSU4_48090 [Pseudonocardia sulfidoxydans NBRC 16205]|uniref:Uncharacterized protein n=1 Tax=Pseudonocardia sulfidoxydans NBRC 16205 TaxID=1223511 RepID=A0A511DM15_9PSEU|nr:hypothetical protein PSU4_48090 [Pseudonocardia sulfidoxydans NBRC 16205]